MSQNTTETTGSATNTSGGKGDVVAVDGKRLWESLMELAKIGSTPNGGVCRLALTDVDKKGRDLVVGWGKAAGLTITTD
ncbi:MAG: hypothetical protein KC657_40265, partial [Myxococcales bacterium]|nr:hypothetical protein [Myxococcales bacterium]